MRLTLRNSAARGLFFCLFGLVLAACGPAEVSSDKALSALAAQIGSREALAQPETAGRMGMSDLQYGGSFSDRLNDRSMSALARTRIARLDQLAALERIDPVLLSPPQRRTRASLIIMMEAVTALDAHGYGSADFARASPYVINLSDGAYSEVVRFLTLSAPLRRRDDIEPWLRRLEALDDSMRDERRRFEVDMADGAIPPAAILARTLEEARRLTPSVPRDHPLVTFFVERLAQMQDIRSEDIDALTRRAVDLVGGDIRREYDQLIALLETSLSAAGDDPGVWRLKDGEAYYAAALRFYTSTDMPAGQLHEAGAKLISDLSKQIEPLLAEAGLSEGAVGARLRQLSDNPAFLLPDTPEGRAALIGRLTEAVAGAQKEFLRLSPVANLPEISVREAVALAEDDTRSAYYSPAALDGSQPATLTVNLRSTLDMPLWILPALAWREATPGRHLPAVIAGSSQTRQLIDYFTPAPAFSEGWALYSDDLGNERGAFRNDRLSQIGYLQALMLKAALMVADTGIHSQKWTRERTISYLSDTVGLSRAKAETEVDHISVWPGLACSAIAGRETLRRLRTQAQNELGAAFDIGAFHSAILAPGPRPLRVLENDIAEWIMSLRPAPPTE